MKTHFLKTHAVLMPALRSGEKNFELRFNDRDYQVNDTLMLKGWDPDTKTYTGEEIAREVSYVLRNAEAYGAQPGYVVLGLRLGVNEPDLSSLAAYKGLQADSIDVSSDTHRPFQSVKIGWATQDKGFGTLTFGVTSKREFFMDAEGMSLRFVQALATQMFIDGHPAQFPQPVEPTPPAAPGA